MKYKFFQCIFIATFLVFVGCREQILHNLGEIDANKLLAALHQVEIEVHKVKQPDGRWALEVSETDSIRAIEFLDHSRLLKELDPLIPEKANLMSSREEQRLQAERSLSHDIETTISSIPYVLEAHVHLNLPERDPVLGRPIGSSEGSASVLIITRRDQNVAKQDVADIVSGASGIKRDAVAVVFSLNIEDSEKGESGMRSFKEKQESSSPAASEVQQQLPQVVPNTASVVHRPVSQNGKNNFLPYAAGLMALLGFWVLSHGLGLSLFRRTPTKGSHATSRAV